MRHLRPDADRRRPAVSPQSCTQWLCRCKDQRIEDLTRKLGATHFVEPPMPWILQAEAGRTQLGPAIFKLHCCLAPAGP